MTHIVTYVTCRDIRDILVVASHLCFPQFLLSSKNASCCSKFFFILSISFCLFTSAYCAMGNLLVNCQTEPGLGFAAFLSFFFLSREGSFDLFFSSFIGEMTRGLISWVTIGLTLSLTAFVAVFLSFGLSGTGGNFLSLGLSRTFTLGAKILIGTVCSIFGTSFLGLTAHVLRSSSRHFFSYLIQSQTDSLLCKCPTGCLMDTSW